MTLAAGDVIGRYRVVRPLGKGGMGSVYEVARTDDGSRYAIKAFTREHGDVEPLKRRFQTEGKALSYLRHPNLLRVHERGEDPKSGLLYFVMDLVLDADGEVRTLADIEPGEVDEEQLKRWYGQIRSVLDYIHAQGVVHRDVKPGNILVNANGDAVLGDFGISRFTDGELRRKLDVESTLEAVDAESRTVMGSIMFLAPEIRRGEKATAAADAYALGVTFYRLLTGIWYEPGPVADGLLAEFGREWVRALRRILSAEPEDRLPIPPVVTPRNSAKRRWCLVGIVVAAAAAIAVWVGRGLLPPRSTGGSRPRLSRPQSRVPRARAGQYTFEQFFPLHTEQPPQ